MIVTRFVTDSVACQLSEPKGPISTTASSRWSFTQNSINFWRAVQGYILDHFQVKVHVPWCFDDSYENFRLAFHFAANQKLQVLSI